jgi:hypothetical protein
MAEHFAQVPGYAVRPETYGPGVFQNVNGVPWTDQQGLSRAWGTTFRGKKDFRIWFHFPITTPTILAGVRQKCNLAAVTLNLAPADAFLQSFHLYDRLNRFFFRDNLNETGDLDDTVVMNRNMFTFPDHEVNGWVGISVMIFFDADADVTFTGAGVRFHD